MDYNHADMPCNIKGFFLHTLNEKLKKLPSSSSSLPLLALDECLNEKSLIDDLGRIVKDGLVHGIERTWYQARVLNDGSGQLLHGSKKPQYQTFELGTPIKGYSWSDADVVCYLISHFVSYEHLIFLTQDKRKNSMGISNILFTEVEPIITQYNQNQYGLTVFMKLPKTSNTDYSTAIRQYVAKKNYKPGFNLIKL